MRAEPLLALAATVSGLHLTDEVLHSIVRGLAEQPDVALARVWLLKPSDICPRCQMRAVCEISAPKALRIRSCSGFIAASRLMISH